jgi:hypothetical protein
MSRSRIYSDFVVKVLAAVIGLNAFPGVALFAAPLGPGNANQLRVETVKAWDEYIRSTDSRMQARLDGQMPFLWMDEALDRSRRIGRGEILVAPVLSHGTSKVPNGLIHDWIGGIFMPGATIKRLSAVLQDYGKYKEFYRPVVVDSKLLECTGMDQRFSMLLRHKVLFITAAIEGEYQASDVKVDSRHGYSVADTVRVQEIENYGNAAERLLPSGTGNGYIWRLHSIARYEERDGGVYLELEAIALTRDIPASVRWLVSPVVNHLSTNSLATTLQQTRDAVNSMPLKTEADSLCSNR